MKTITNNLTLLNKATNLVINKYHLQKSLEIVSMIKLLRCKLVDGTAHFIYKKKDGTLREAWGTLLEKVADRNINGRGYSRKLDGLQVYFDIEEQEWRSFKLKILLLFSNTKVACCISLGNATSNNKKHSLLKLVKQINA